MTFGEAAIQEKADFFYLMGLSQTESRPRVLRDTISEDQDNAPEVEGGTTS